MVWFKTEDYAAKKSSGSKPRWQVKRRFATQDKSSDYWCRNCLRPIKLENIIEVEQAGIKRKIVKKCSECGVQKIIPLTTKPKGAL